MTTNCGCGMNGGKRTLKLRKQKGGFLDGVKKWVSDTGSYASEGLKNIDNKLGDFGNNISSRFQDMTKKITGNRTNSYTTYGGKKHRKTLKGGNVAKNAMEVSDIKVAQPTYYINSDGSTNPPKNLIGGKKSYRKIRKIKRSVKKTKKNRKY